MGSGKRPVGSVPAPVIDPGETIETILLLNGEFGNVIRHADTKAALMLTTVAAVLSQVGGQIGLRWVPEVLPQITFWMTLLLVGFAGWTIYCLVQVLLPRIQAPEGNSRYAWPSLAAMSETKARGLGIVPSPEEAWAQARVLALICQRKFLWAKRATYGTVAVLVLCLALYLLP